MGARLFNFSESLIQSTKLSREAFARALRHGRGCVVTHLRDHSMDGVEDLVLAACIEDQSHDRQCEDSRADWLYSFFKGTPAYPRFAETILAALAQGNDDGHFDYDGAQVRHLASLMGRDGDLEAADRLRAFVRGQTLSDNGLPGASALCAVDGLSAVVDIARRIGQVLQQDPEAWFHTLESLTDDVLSFDDTFAELKRLAPDDPAIAAYVAREDARIAEEAAPERPAQEQADASKRYGDDFMRENPVESIIEAAAGKSAARGLFNRFGRWAAQEDVDRILDHLREQRDPDICKKLLWVFRSATLPRVDARVWELASHASAEVRNAAVVALSGVTDPRVRELGMARLRDPGFSSEFSDAIALFKYNFEPGDEALILSALERQTVDDDAAHALGSSALDVCASVGSPALGGVAQWIYRTNPCTICRQMAVERMQEWDCLPADIAAECRYDASDEVRALFGTTP